MMRARSFQATLLLIIVAGLVLLQAATLLAVRVAGERTVRHVVSEELRVGGRLLNRFLLTRGRQLAETVRVLAADFAFREAVASEDRPTITSVLTNHGERIGADAAFLIRLNGSVAADTLDGRFVDRPFAQPALIARALGQGTAAAVVSFGGVPYQLVMVPVLAPEPIALVCMGFDVDEAVLDEIARLTALDVSLWSPVPGSPPQLVSTLAPPLQTALIEEAALFQPHGEPRHERVTLGPQTYALLSQPLENVERGAVNMLLLRSIEQARQPFRRLELQIFALTSLGLVAAVGAAIVLARSVGRPLNALAEAAHRIERGDYSTKVGLDRGDEIGMLATALDNMRRGIGEREEHIQFQATHDSLTGLPNRTLFIDRLAQAIGRAKRSGNLVGMLIMDLDRFKEINDTLGHQLGDELLAEFGRRLLEATRESDTVARLGGDEFALLFETDDITHAADVARRTGRALDAPFGLGGVSIDVKASMGIAFYPLHAEDPGTLMKRADVAMYDAKRSQQPFAVYESVRDEHSLRRLAILSELRQAITGGQLELHYQPKVEMASSHAVRAEALVRWRHPVHGLLQPAEFVPLAEHSGSIGLLTKWVLRRAIADCAAWSRAGRELSVAVNLSALDLYDAELAAYIEALLHEQQLPPSRLVVELTESAVMRDPAQAAKILQALKRSGVGLAIDDFGTGYSSLALLKRLPVDELKIDKSFVLNLSEAPTEDQVIVRSTIELGHNMGLRVIAEGVESAAGWELLKGLGCDMAQGFYVSRPLPSEGLLTWLKESRWGGGG